MSSLFPTTSIIKSHQVVKGPLKLRQEVQSEFIFQTNSVILFFSLVLSGSDLISATSSGCRYTHMEFLPAVHIVAFLHLFPERDIQKIND